MIGLMMRECGVKRYNETKTIFFINWSNKSLICMNKSFFIFGYNAVKNIIEIWRSFLSDTNTVFRNLTEFLWTHKKKVFIEILLSFFRDFSETQNTHNLGMWRRYFRKFLDTIKNTFLEIRWSFFRDFLKMINTVFRNLTNIFPEF